MLYFLGCRPRERPRPIFHSSLPRQISTARNSSCSRPKTPITIFRSPPPGDYFVDSYSRPDVPPVTVLRDADGKLISTLEKADISKLLAAGWKPPQPITVKARDGVTDLYGLMFKPT